ncbi:MAG: hypothetical protein J7L15_08815 [Clostridiales bacterium]|nr:hypothetical protein [Clostridiales bacterium]
MKTEQIAGLLALGVAGYIGYKAYSGASESSQKPLPALGSGALGQGGMISGASYETAGTTPISKKEAVTSEEPVSSGVHINVEAPTITFPTSVSDRPSVKDIKRVVSEVNTHETKKEKKKTPEGYFFPKEVPEGVTPPRVISVREAGMTKKQQVAKAVTTYVAYSHPIAFGLFNKLSHSFKRWL